MDKNTLQERIERSSREASKYPDWVKTSNRFQGEGITRSNQSIVGHSSKERTVEQKS